MSLLNKLFRFDFGYLDDPHSYRCPFERWAFEFTIKIKEGPDISWFYCYESNMPLHQRYDLGKDYVRVFIEKYISGKPIFASDHWYPANRITEVIFEEAYKVRKWYETERGNDVVFQSDDPEYGFSIK